MIQSSFRQLADILLFSWLGIGTVTTVAGFLGFFYPWLSILLVIPISLTILILWRSVKRITHFKKWEKIFFSLIVIWWLLHLPQVFVPETGFDALWYHLPVAELVTTHHRFVADQNLYQSFNPLFADSIFYLGYQIWGDFGAKMVAYLIGLTCIVATYFLARMILDRRYALAAAMIASGFQVLSWQSSSFYIDVAKAVFELSALLFILRRSDFSSIKSALFIGASMASKLFSIVLLPIYLIISYFNTKKFNFFWSVGMALLLALPYLLFSYQAVGNPLYSLSHHANKLDEIGGESSVLTYLGARTIRLYQLPFIIGITRDYTSPLLLTFLPLLILVQESVKDKKILSLLFIGLAQLLLWWYLPPLSTRYAFSGFIVLTICTVWLLQTLWKKYKWQPKYLLLLLLSFGMLAMPIRIMIIARSWQYISGNQSREEYLEQFMDGNIDQHIENWYKI